MEGSCGGCYGGWGWGGGGEWKGHAIFLVDGLDGLTYQNNIRL